MMLQNKTEQERRVWKSFVKRFSLSDRQQEQFLSYLSFLIEENKKFNITAITDFTSIVNDHFTDSLAFVENYDLSQSKILIDVGSGGGLPGMPLKIAYPHLHVVLIEVNQKKADFLEQVAEKLGLDGVEVCDQDWRSFVRGYDKQPDVVVSRASLQIDELLRMFKPSSMLKDAILVYWASQHWQPTANQASYVMKEEQYYVEHKLRRLIFFQDNTGE